MCAVILDFRYDGAQNCQLAWKIGKEWRKYIMIVSSVYLIGMAV